jgi:hypothetical protein
VLLLAAADARVALSDAAALALLREERRVDMFGD